MDEITREEAFAWLSKARRDVDSAERLIAGTPPYRDTATYHCQQSAEKALKAYLTASAIPFPKSHDLTVLVTLAAQSLPELALLSEAAIVLTPYATLFRYPDAVMEPSDDDVAEALQLAHSVVQTVERLLDPHSQ